MLHRCLADSSLLAQIQMCQHVFQTKLGQRTIEAMQLITLRPGGYDSQLGGGAIVKLGVNLVEYSFPI